MHVFMCMMCVCVWICTCECGTMYAYNSMHVEARENLSGGVSPPLTRYRNSLLSYSLVYWKLSGLWDSGEFLVSISNLTVKMLGPHISYHLYKFQSMPVFATTYTPINSPAQVYLLGWQALYLLNHIHSTDFFFYLFIQFLLYYYSKFLYST